MLVRRASLFALLLSFVGGGTASAQAPPLGRVSGTVFDSMAAKPLVNAVVQLVATGEPARVLSTSTDEQGRFAFDAVMPGSYLAGVLHPRVDSLLIRPPLRAVTVRPERVADATLFLPSARALRLAFCGASAMGDSPTGVFMGRLRGASEGRMPTAGRVRAEWREFVIDGSGGRTDISGVDANTAGDGAFALCGLPVAAMISLRAWAGTDSSGVVDVTLPDDGVLRRDLLVGPASLASTGYLRGTVRLASGAAVAGARVTVRESGVQVVADGSGAFTLRDLPLGTHALETQAVGYEPRRTAVDIADSIAVASIDVVLEPLGQAIDTVRVNATRVPLADRWMSGFEERRKLGHGHFMDEAKVEKLNAISATDLLRFAPGVSVIPLPGRATRNIVVFTRHGSCSPNVFIDGVLLNGAGIDEVVSSQEVRSVEVYTSAVNRPAEFTTANGCGTIVIWRGMRKIPQ